MTNRESPDEDEFGPYLEDAIRDEELAGDAIKPGRPRVLCRKWFNYHRALWFWFWHGYWCPHTNLTEWKMVDTGARKVRYCEDCPQTDWI